VAVEAEQEDEGKIHRVDQIAGFAKLRQALENTPMAPLHGGHGGAERRA
jgi:hypothetical protein